MPASGCFEPELGALIPLERLGALVTMLDAVGIASMGTDGFTDGLLRGYLEPGPAEHRRSR